MAEFRDFQGNVKKIESMTPEEVDKVIHGVPFKLLAREYAKRCTDNEIIQLFDYWFTRKEFSRISKMIKQLSKRERDVKGLDLTKYTETIK